MAEAPGPILFVSRVSIALTHTVCAAKGELFGRLTRDVPLEARDPERARIDHAKCDREIVRIRTTTILDLAKTCAIPKGYHRAVANFTVRAMKREDLPEVGVLAGKLVRMHHEFDRLRFLEPKDPEKGYQWWFGTQIEKKETILLVAADAEGVCGYVYAAFQERDYNDLLDPCVKLHDILVADRAQKRGIGEALVEETFKRAAAGGAPRVVLLTATQNEGAQRLFKRCGFRTTMLEMTAELPKKPDVSPKQT
jgi:ribosomal protein S18 acetylase RimI-like enzyme